MNTYLRFQTRLPCERTRRPLGVFTAAGVVKDMSNLEPHVRSRLETSLTWFNQNLTVPPQSLYSWRCIFWFRSDAQRLVSRIWDLVAILNETGVFVRKLWTTDPGMIVYSDQYQIGAVPCSRR